MRLCPLERGLAVIRLDHRVTVLLKKLASQAAHDFVVFDEQDCSGSPFWPDRLDFSAGSEPDFVLRAGKIDLERRALSRFTVNQNVPRALFDNAIYGGQAQTGSLAGLFGGEEGFKDARYRGFIHATAGIADREQDIFSGCHGLMLVGKFLVESH